MTTPGPDPDRLIELLKHAADAWISLAGTTAWVDLLGYWRGTEDLLKFAVRYPTVGSQKSASALPCCVVLVEFARWARTADPPDEASEILLEQCERLLNVQPALKQTTLIQAITHTVLATISWNDRPQILDHLRQAASLYDREWSLTGLRTGQSPVPPVAPDFALEDTKIGHRGHRLLDLAEQMGAFGTEGVSISTWLVLHDLLGRIYGDDNRENIWDNGIKAMLYDPVYRRGQIARMSFEMVKAPALGVYLDPLAFGITRVGKSMRNSLRLGFRCCRKNVADKNVADKSAAIRLSGVVPVQVASLNGSSGGGLFAAAMIATARHWRIDTTRSATCRLAMTALQRAESEQLPLDARDVGLGSISGAIRKIDEAWQREHGIEEAFLSEADEKVWREANPGRQHPRVTPTRTLDELLAGLTANQILDLALDRHARWVHAAWYRVREAIRNDTPEADRDHRFDCYIEPTFRIEGPLSTPEPSMEDHPDSEVEELSRRRISASIREEFPVPGDSTSDEDEQLLNLLELSVRGRSFLVPEDGSPPPTWLKPGRPIVIYDVAGAGKTVCSHRLRHLLTDERHRERLFGHKLAPLVVRLDGRWRREFNDQGRLLTIAELLVEVFAEDLIDRRGVEDRPLIQRTVDHALRESRVVLILDGFDQFPEEDRKHVVTVFTAHENARHCRWVLTSRVHTIDDLRSANQFFRDDEWTRVRIDPFTSDQQDRYFDRTDANGRTIGRRWLETIGGEGNRPALNELLGLPMVLWMIRVLVDEADRRQEPLPVFSSLSQLYLVTSRKLLARALELNRREVEERLTTRHIAIPHLTVEQQLTGLEYVLTLMAFQLMLMEEYNGEVGGDRIRRFEELCKDRYFHQLDQELQNETRDRYKHALHRDLEGREQQWTWAVEVLKTIELSHRSVTEAYNDAGLAFRSRKMLECHAARYLTCYATEWDVFAGRNSDDMPVVDPQDEKQDLSTLCAWNYTTHPQWKDTWELAIEMPREPVSAHDHDGVIARAVMNHEVACRTLSALFERPKAWPARDIRPTELIWRAWHLFEIDLPLLRERRFLISGQMVAGRKLDDATLRSLGERMLLGVLPKKQAIVKARLVVLEQFRSANRVLTEQMNARLDTVLDQHGQRRKLPADATERKQLLSQWQQQSSTEKSQTFLQCPPQSLLEAFQSLPAPRRTAQRNPCINDGIEGHETERLKPIQIQATTVTRVMYAVFDPAFERSHLEPNWGDGDLQQTLQKRASGFDEHTDDGVFPILCTNWFDAWVFGKFLGAEYRLPTEFEWEHGCRAGTKTDYHFGNGLNGVQANCDGNYPHGQDNTGKELGKGPYLERTTPVGCVKYPCNDYGLFDVHGNAWEWCLDRRDSDDDSPGSSRVLRGGSWFNFADYCRSADRNDYTPDYRSNNLGFRVVRE